MGENFFIEGIPVSSKVKVFSVIAGFLLLIINHNLPVFNAAWDYANRDWVSVGILFVVVIISIGSTLAEGIIIGIALFSVMSAMYDITVIDISNLRFQIIVGGIAVLMIASLFGKISIFRIFQGQLGLEKIK